MQSNQALPIARHPITTHSFCPELSQPKADAPPTGFEELGLLVNGGFDSMDGDRRSFPVGLWFSLREAPNLLLSPFRGGIASKPVGCGNEGVLLVFKRAGLRTFIPRPRLAR